ncbi:MAG: hypothetical protein IPN29_02965 [Saprospiraceae bacterium]|nr:hypothetical protein [Saprospiraceae bacterium]
MPKDELKLNYADQKNILKNFYDQMGLYSSFEKDNRYLESAFAEITEIWYDNLAQIEEVKYLMIAEAPLWGIPKNIYTIPGQTKHNFCIEMIWELF